MMWICATILSIIASALAAYAIVRLRYRGAQWFGGSSSLPNRAALDPVHSAGDRRIPVRPVLLAMAPTATYPTILIPFSTWLLMGYFKTIPFELEECALILRRQSRTDPDGAAAGDPRPDLRVHLLLHAVLVSSSMPSRSCNRPRTRRLSRDRQLVRRRRHLSLGLADGGGAGGVCGYLMPSSSSITCGDDGAVKE